MKKAKTIEFGYGFPDTRCLSELKGKKVPSDLGEGFLKASGISKKHWNRFSNMRIDKEGRMLADYLIK